MDLDAPADHAVLEPHRSDLDDDRNDHSLQACASAAAVPRGQRLLSKVPFGHWKTQTFIAALRRCDALTAPLH